MKEDERFEKSFQASDKGGYWRLENVCECVFRCDCFNTVPEVLSSRDIFCV